MLAAHAPVRLCPALRRACFAAITDSPVGFARNRDEKKFMWITQDNCEGLGRGVGQE
jgi:hypothetical protein